MKTKFLALIIVLGIFSVVVLPSVYAIPTVEIVMEKSTYRYCEKLFYTIDVSEITGDSAIIHIRDQTGLNGSGVPIPINYKNNPILAPYPFDKEFPLGKYFIDVEYSGAKNSAEFNLVDSKNICIPFTTKQIAGFWINGNISDGYFIDAINREVDKNLITIPDKIKEKNFEAVHIPKWVKNTAGWWLGNKISDDEFSHAMQYLFNKEIIVI